MIPTNLVLSRLTTIYKESNGFKPKIALIRLLKIGNDQEAHVAAEVSINLARYIGKDELLLEFDLDPDNHLSVMTSVCVKKQV